MKANNSETGNREIVNNGIILKSTAIEVYMKSADAIQIWNKIIPDLLGLLC